MPSLSTPTSEVQSMPSSPRAIDGAATMFGASTPDSACDTSFAASRCGGTSSSARRAIAGSSARPARTFNLSGE